MQDRQSVSVNRTDTSISHSKQLDSAIPASKIAALSSGEFVGLVADNPDEKIKLKMFHAEIINDAKKLNDEVSRYKDQHEMCPEQVKSLLPGTQQSFGCGLITRRSQVQILPPPLKRPGQKLFLARSCRVGATTVQPFATQPRRRHRRTTADRHCGADRDEPAVAAGDRDADEYW